MCRMCAVTSACCGVHVVVCTTRANRRACSPSNFVRSCGRAVEHARVNSGDASCGNVERARGSRANRNDYADEANGRGGDDDDDDA